MDHRHGQSISKYDDTDHEAGEGPVVAVQEQHGERGQLTGPVPAVAAVNHTAGAMHTHLA